MRSQQSDMQMDSPGVTPEFQLPDFFVVGAPKCGTTALDHYLTAHPEVFMAARKESHHFATDLLPPDDKYRSEKAYRELFKGRGDARRVGESSVMYLYSRMAAGAIRAAAPNARIVVMLRDPVTMIPSLHSQNLFNGHETETDLIRALEAEPERSARLHERGLRIPQRVLYRDVANYAPQLQRYFNVFGRDRVHVILYEELKSDPASAYQKVLEFLNVDPTFRPDFHVVNPNKVPRWGPLTRLLNRPPSWARGMLHWIDPPAPVRRALRARLVKLNTRQEARAPIDPAVATRLRQEMAPSVTALEDLLGRDLSIWRDPSSRR